MNILIYGIGVLGSYLAYELDRGGHNVTLLARGKRLQALRTQGLTIEHFLQKRITKKVYKTTNEFATDDEYDLVFVVMQKMQTDEIIPTLAANRKCRMIALIGNNAEAEKTQKKFMSLSETKPTLLFGFLGIGGRHQSDRIVSVHQNTSKMAIGSLTKDDSYRTVLDAAMAHTSIKLYHSPDIDAWLKYHLTFIVPVVYAIDWANGDMKKLSKSNAMIRLTVQAIREAIEVLESLGYPPEPEKGMKMMKKSKFRMFWMLKIISKLKIGELIARDHAMAAITEMAELAREFKSLQSKSEVKTPALDEMEQFLIKA